MPRKAEAYLSSVSYGTIKYSLTPLGTGKAKLEIDLSQARLDNLPEVRDSFLKPFDGNTERVISEEEALKVLEQFLAWGATTGTILRTGETDIIFMQHDVIAAIANQLQQELERQQKGADGAPATTGTESQVQAAPTSGQAEGGGEEGEGDLQLEL